MSDVPILEACNTKSRLASRLHASGARAVADGARRVRGGLPERTMHVDDASALETAAETT